ncbi:MAG: helix-hairpin-helix domain-containing protein [Paludibacteraceae bacterium]|nr:helix-hairpin-helix domain-containing protein [Paludibacteraceae bacterium]
MTKKQLIGALLLLGIAAAAWLFVATRPTSSLPVVLTEETGTRDSLRRALRADSIARARARRDSLREVRWEHIKDSFRQIDDARFAAWTAERQARYDSFRLADSLWKDSVGWHFPQHIKKDTFLDLNHCDTIELQFIRGIGRYTAQRIVEYRTQLGGFYSPAQLTDEPFSRMRLDTILYRFSASPQDILTIDVNSAGIDELNSHPYLRYRQAKAIYTLRRKYVRLSSIDDLRSLPELTEEDLHKLQYYLRFD